MIDLGLTKLGLMRPAGIKAFEARKGDKTGIYAYEQRKSAKLPPAYEKKFRANKKAWAFFHARAASYRRAAIWWVINAKRDETRKKRLETLIRDSKSGRTVRPLSPRSRPG